LDDEFEFPPLHLRPEVSDPGKVYAPENRGLINDIYNPSYFADLPKGFDMVGPCNDIAEIEPSRDCFRPIYGHGCLNSAAPIYEAPIAFWTSVFGDRIPPAGGIAARSAVWGFEPVFFNPDEVKTAIEIILFDEWQLPRVPETRTQR
jgi:hypothetical protein